jgi:DNA-binding protein H-NS
MSTKLQEILAKRAALEEEAERVRAQELEEVIQSLRKTIADYRLTPLDLFPDHKLMPRHTPSRNPKRVVKYRSKDGKPWGGGVGPKPKWVKEVLARGENIEDYAVTGG